MGDERDETETETDKRDDSERDESIEDRVEDVAEYGSADDDQIYNDRSKLDFDPEDGLLSGTALDGTSEIPGSGNDGDDDEANDAEQDEEPGSTVSE